MSIIKKFYGPKKKINVLVGESKKGIEFQGVICILYIVSEKRKLNSLRYGNRNFL